MSVLEARGLTVDYRQRHGRPMRAVDQVTFGLEAGETLALVGESGSGKSTVARALARLVPTSGGEILLHGEAAPLRGRRLRAYRRDVQLVFQDPFASLNPAFSVAHHLRRSLALSGHRRRELDAKVLELLESVKLVPSAAIASKYPHELSGGQRQRVAIARALAPQPSVLLADEPVSMLDVSVRLEILNLLDELKRERHLALLYITHDLATARHFSTHIMVMYHGEVVEHGRADDVILHPVHPYTQLLASAVPKPGVSRADMAEQRRARQLATKDLRGGRSGNDNARQGCRFRGRCPYAMDTCAAHPADVVVGTEHSVRCWLSVPNASEPREGAGADKAP